MKKMKLLITLIILFVTTFFIDRLGLYVANRVFNYWIYHIIFILNSALRFELILLVALTIFKVDVLSKIKSHKILSGLQFIITIVIFALINNSLYFSLVPGKLLSNINEMRYLVTSLYFLFCVVTFKYSKK